MLLLGHLKHLKYSSYFQKILKLHLRDGLSYGQLNVVCEIQTAFSCFFREERVKSVINYSFQNF